MSSERAASTQQLAVPAARGAVPDERRSASGEPLEEALGVQDAASSLAFAAASKTFALREGRVGTPVQTKVAPFSFLLDVAGAPIAVTSDGIGTKIEVAERLGRFDTLGFDLLAMVIDDLAANGIEPIAVTNTLDVDRLDLRIVGELMEGLRAAATAAHVVLAGGEIAELGPRISGFGEQMHFNWCATAIGTLVKGASYIDGSAVRPGDIVVGIESRGLRSNGFSAARRILQNSFGTDWHCALFEGKSWGDWLLTPCELYAPFVRRALAAGVPIHGLAHITGGGLASKLGRTLRATGAGATIDTPLPIPPFVTELIRLGAMPMRDAYAQWNLGQGFVIIVPPDAVPTLLSVECPYARAPIGHITEDALLVVRGERYSLSSEAR